ncbi:MAG: hypothetical protein ACREFY_19770 [Acetobacteraceae bacterium]
MSAESAAPRTGLLLAMMEPPAAMEEEFQDWYDTEHFPERAGTEGFATAQRLICLEGWPRYLALYDLSSLAVLDGPGYAAIARNRYSRWTQRIIPRVWGHYRAEAEQLHPGNALLGASGVPSRVALWRFRNASATSDEAIIVGARASFAHTPGLLQLRIFRARATDTCDYLVTAELAGAVPMPPPDATAFGAALGHLDLANLYMPYWR